MPAPHGVFFMVLPGTSLNNKPFRRTFPTKKLVKLVVMVVAVALPLWGLYALLSRNPSSGSEALGAVSTTSSGTSVAGPVAAMDINRDFLYPLTTEENGPMLNMSVTDAEKRKEILVKGQKATAIDGRLFLIINLKYKNDAQSGLEVDSRDYFRLSTNGNQSEWMAPEIHNDPVEVQAISSKTTRLGFPINENDTQLLLQVGELKGEKTQISLEF